MANKLYPTKTRRSKSNCPRCGFEIAAKHSFETILSGQFANEQNGDYEAVRETPSRTYSVEADLLVPVGQALVTGLIAVLPASAVSFYFSAGWYPVLVVFSAATSLSWARCLDIARSSAMVTETFSYNASSGDLSGGLDKETGAPVRLEVVHETSGIKHKMQLLDLPDKITERQFGEFLKDILAGRSMARKNWVGSGKPFSRDVYDQLLARLVEAGIVNLIENNEKRLTNGGKKAIAAMVRGGEI